MASNPEYIWNFDLLPYPLDTESQITYSASVLTGNDPITMEDIVNSIVSDRTDLRADTLLTAGKLIAQKVRQYLYRGRIVVTENVVMQPVITGKFTGTVGTVDPDKNQLRIACNMSNTLRSGLEEVTPRYTGHSLTNGGARVNSVLDNLTGLTDGTATPGGQFFVYGLKIKCLAADGTSTGNISFINTDGQTAATLNTFAINEPRRLLIQIPHIPAGQYTLRIETYYFSGNRTLKTARHIDTTINVVE